MTKKYPRQPSPRDVDPSTFTLDIRYMRDHNPATSDWNCPTFQIIRYAMSLTSNSRPELRFVHMTGMHKSALLYRDTGLRQASLWSILICETRPAEFPVCPTDRNTWPASPTAEPEHIFMMERPISQAILNNPRCLRKQKSARSFAKCVYHHLDHQRKLSGSMNPLVSPVVRS